MIKYLLLFLFFGGIVHEAVAQKSAIALNLQAYPAGVITNVQYAFLKGPSSLLGLHAGLNITNRRDWGEHDDETGNGGGLGASWRYYLNDAPAGLYAGIRTDLWFLTIDWTQNSGEAGATDITVFQPTAQLGYTLLLRNSPLMFDASASLGAEINVKTEGEAVGEGAILLVGIGIGYRF